MAREWQTDGLRNIDLFKGLDDRQIETVGQRCRWIEFDEGQQIIGQSDQSTDVYFIVEGSVRAKSYSAAGREVSFVDIEKGSLFGEFAAVDGRPRASSVIAVTPCLLGCMSAKAFQITLSENPTAALRLIELLVEKARSYSDRVFEFSTLPVHSRVTIELLRMAELAPEHDNRPVIQPAPTHHEFAARISTHREAVTRELNNLAAERVIDLRRGRVEILDLQKLKSLVGEALNS